MKNACFIGFMFFSMISTSLASNNPQEGCEASRQTVTLDFVDLSFDFCTSHVFVSKKAKEWMYLKVFDQATGTVLLQKILILQKTHELPLVFGHGQRFIVEIRFSQTKSKISSLLSLLAGKLEKAGKEEVEAEAQKIKWTKVIREEISLK